MAKSTNKRAVQDRPKLEVIKPKRRLPIQTIYYIGKKVAKKNRGGTSFRAVPRCVEHMQINKYEATVAEVHDLSSGVLHAVVTRNINGGIQIVFKREVKEGV